MPRCHRPWEPLPGLQQHPLSHSWWIHPPCRPTRPTSGGWSKPSSQPGSWSPLLPSSCGPRQRGTQHPSPSAPQEVEQMVKDAESHAGEDRKKKEEVETRNQAENLVYSTRRSLGELGDKVDGSTKSEIEDAAAALEEATKGDDIEAIKTKMQTLQEAAHKLSEAAYEAAQSAHGDGEAGGGASAEGDEEEVVEEAEYEVIDEDQ